MAASLWLVTPLLLPHRWEASSIDCCAPSMQATLQPSHATVLHTPWSLLPLAETYCCKSLELMAKPAKATTGSALLQTAAAQRLWQMFGISWALTVTPLPGAQLLSGSLLGASRDGFTGPRPPISETASQASADSGTLLMAFSNNASCDYTQFSRPCINPLSFSVKGDKFDLGATDENFCEFDTGLPMTISGAGLPAGDPMFVLA